MPSATSAVSDPVAAPSSTKRNAAWLNSAVASVMITRVPRSPGDGAARARTYRRYCSTARLSSLVLVVTKSRSPHVNFVDAATRGLDSVYLLRLRRARRRDCVQPDPRPLGALGENRTGRCLI